MTLEIYEENKTLDNFCEDYMNTYLFRNGEYILFIRKRFNDFGSVQEEQFVTFVECGMWHDSPPPSWLNERVFQVIVKDEILEIDLW